MSLHRVSIVVLLTASLLHVARDAAAQPCDSVLCDLAFESCKGNAIGHEQRCEFFDCADEQDAVARLCQVGLFSPPCTVAIARLRLCMTRCRAKFLQDVGQCLSQRALCEHGIVCAPTLTPTRTSTPIPATPMDTPTQTPPRVPG